MHNLLSVNNKAKTQTLRTTFLITQKVIIQQKLVLKALGTKFLKGDLFLDLYKKTRFILHRMPNKV